MTPFRTAPRGRIALFAALAAVLAGGLAGQAPGPKDAKWPLRAVRIEGSRVFTVPQIAAATGLEIGAPVNQGDFEAARDRLLATGAFETIAFRFGPAAGGQGYDVVFEVAEIAQVYPVRFENIGAPESELRDWLTRKEPIFGEMLPGTEQLMGRFSRLIEEFLAARQTPREIRGELTADLPDQFYILFHPKDDMPAVAEVDFTGNQVVPAERLREAIHGVAVGSRFSEGRFRLILNSGLRPVYEMRGRIGVSFPKITTAPAGGGVSGVKVTVTVDEGESYSFGRVSVEGTLSMNARLVEASGLKPGDVANLNELPAAADRIVEVLREEGYMGAKASAQRRVNEEKRTVDIAFAVDPGPQYSFGRLFVEGLDLHGEHEVKRIWGLKEGALFKASYPDYFLQRLREDGLFDNLRKAVSKAVPREETRTVDVTLVFNPPERKGRFGEP